VFDCRLVADHPMTEHFPEPLWVPHSRYNDLPEQALADCGYKVLTRSNAAGVDAFAKQDGSFFLFFQGHPEYEADTLLREYRRDAARFLAGEREHYPQMPLGYFNDDAAAMGEAFQTLALRDRRSELIAEFPKSSLEAGLQCPWRAAALGTYEKWCAYLSARKAERRTAAVPLPGVRQRRTWRDWPLGARQPARSSLP
jgi:homoserine O-succinyltransferase